MAARTLGKYELTELLGAGGMAEVWRAAVRGAAGFRRDVALKTIRGDLAADASFVNMLVNEACLSAALDHPNIVATLDFGCLSGTYFLAMEMVDGASLGACLHHLAAKGCGFDQWLAAYVIAEVAAALDHAHRAVDASGKAMDIVHRDVNPANILISLHGEVKLGDFGIARAAGRSAGTEVGALKGKIAYMSPEQAWGRTLDHRSDLFSLGLTLYELVTGRRAYEGDGSIAVLERARAAEVGALPARLAPEIARTLERTLCAEPARRAGTAGELRAMLEPLLRGQRDGQVELASIVAEVRAAQPPSVVPVSEPRGPDLPVDGPSSTLAAIATEAGGEGAVVVQGAARRRLWAVGLAGGGVIVALLGFLLGRPRPAPPPVSTTATDLRATATTPPPAGRPPSMAPSVSTARPVARPAAKPRRPGSTINVTHGELATLRIQVEPWGNVWLDDRPLGMSPLRPLDVSPGSHVILARHPSLGAKQASVRLAPGEGKLVTLDLGARDGH